MAAITATTMRGAGGFTTNGTGGSTGDTFTLPALGVGVGHAITDIMLTHAGTLSVVKITVANSGGTPIYGEIGSATVSASGGLKYSFVRPILCGLNNATLITLTLTGATAASVGITVNYTAYNG